MRILLYGINLGSHNVSHLHLGKIANEFKEFFKENGFDIITFDPFGLSQIRFDFGESIFSVLKKLPKGWEPDLILIQGPEYLTLPTHPYECEYPIVFATCDFDYEIQRVFHLFEIADCVICYSEESERRIKKIGARYTIKFPIWFGYDPKVVGLKSLDLESIPSPTRRKTDIFYSGNIIGEEKHIFLSILFSIARRNNLNLKVNRGYLNPERYYEELKNSKIVFTYHRRKEIQRPEAILCGACLMTNSKEFGEIFKENEDFFVYDAVFSPIEFRNDRKIEDVERKIEEKIVNALSQIEKIDWERRKERILSLQDKMSSKNRLLEMLRKIKENIGTIKENARDRVRESKRGEKALDFRQRMNFQSSDIFSVITAIPVGVQDHMLNSLFDFYLMKFEEMSSALNYKVEDEARLLGNKITLMFVGNPYNEREIDALFQKSLIKGGNLITSMNYAVMKFQRYRFSDALRALEISLSIVRKEERLKEELKLLKDIFFVPHISRLIRREELYFPEISDLITQSVESGEILPDEKLKTAIISYINFLKGLCLRKLGYGKSSEFIKFSSENFPAKYTWRFELAKSLIEEGKIGEVLENSILCAKTSADIKVAELLISSILESKTEDLQKIQEKEWNYIKFFIKKVYEMEISSKKVKTNSNSGREKLERRENTDLDSSTWVKEEIFYEKILEIIEMKRAGGLENSGRSEMKRALLVGAVSEVEGLYPLVMWIYDNVFQNFDFLLITKDNIKGLVETNLRSILKSRSRNSNIFVISGGKDDVSTQNVLDEIKKFAKEGYEIITFIPEGVKMSDIKLFFDYSLISNSYFQAVVSSLENAEIFTSDINMSTKAKSLKIISVRPNIISLLDLENTRKPSDDFSGKILFYNIPSGGRILSEPKITFDDIFQFL